MNILARKRNREARREKTEKRSERRQGRRKERRGGGRRRGEEEERRRSKCIASKNKNPTLRMWGKKGITIVKTKCVHCVLQCFYTTHDKNVVKHNENNYFQ